MLKSREVPFAAGAETQTPCRLALPRSPYTAPNEEILATQLPHIVGVAPGGDETWSPGAPGAMYHSYATAAIRHIFNISFCQLKAYVTSDLIQ